MAGVGTEITEYLKEYHMTEAKAIKGRDLCELFNVKDKQLRNIITVLRQEQKPICSSSNGYWYSKAPEDLEKTLHRMEAQVHNMNFSITGLKRILQEVKENEKEESGKEKK